jgi:hypothetical protein
LREWRFYALLALSLLAWTAAYQYKTEYQLNIGGLYDDAFVSEFHGKEGNEERDYRWSRGYSTLHFPGIGNQPVSVTLTLIGFRPDGTSPQVEIEARGQKQSLQTTGAPQAHTFFWPRGDALQGDLSISIGSPTFSPPNDPRELGVLVDRVVVRPADFGLRPVVVPPLGTLGGLLAGLVGVYLCVVVATRRVRWGLLGVAILGALFTLLIVVARLELGLLAPQLAVLALWALAITLLSRLVLDRLLAPLGRGAEIAAGLGALATAGAFVLRFGGLTYPQFLTSDLLLHVHNVQRVVGGEWVFPGFLPDYTAVPYPPALYVILAPFAILMGTGDGSISLLLKFSASLLDAVCCIGLAWAGARLWGGRAGGLAAVLYAVSPAPFELFSAGNYTNLFAQDVLNFTLLGALVYLASPDDGRRTAATWYELQATSIKPTALGAKRRPQRAAFIPAIALAAGFALTMLGHYGMMLGMLPIIGLFGLWIAYAAIGGRGSRRGWLVLAGFGGALLASFALYYRYFVNEIWAQWSGIFRRFSEGASGGIAATAASEGFLERSARRISQLIGFQTLLPALAGAFLPVRQAPVRVLLNAWLLAAAFFFLVDQALGDAVRWYFLAAAPISLLAGRYLGEIAGRNRTGIALTALLVTAALWHLLQIWVGDLIFTRYH